MNLRIVYRSALTLLLAVACSNAFGWQNDKRPPSDELLPETTVLYLQARDIPELIEDMQSSNFGRMMADESIAPLMDELWAQAKEGFQDLAESQDIGLSLTDLTSLPHGEICFAAIAPRRQDMQFVMIVDIDDESESLNKVLDRGRELAEGDGATIEDEETEDAVFTTIQGSGGGPQMTVFRKDGSVVITTNRELSQQILDRWLKRPIEDIRPLKDNRKFVTIMNRCRGTKEVQPEFRMFMDPVEFFKSVTRGNAGAQLAVGFLPVLGLDGLLALGGSSILNEGEFQSVNHFHIMLANPRAGIVEMLAMKPSDYKPGPWVPDNVMNYMATSWDVDRMFAELTKIVNTFAGDGVFEQQIEDNINNQLDLDFKDDVLAAIDGTFTWIQWGEPPARVNSQSNGIALGLRDVEKAEETFKKIIDRINEELGEDSSQMVEESHKGVTMWRFDDPAQRERFEMMREEGNMQVNLRAPEPSFAFVGDYLVFGDSAGIVKACIEADKGDIPRLNENEKFKMISDKMTRLLGTDMPTGLIFSQPEYIFEQWLEVAKGDDVKGFLSTQAEDNQYVDGVRRALEDNPLPDFEKIRKYFAPSGAFVTSDDTGYHILQFEVKAKDD